MVILGNVPRREPGSRSTLLDHPQGTDVQANRRYRGGTDDVAPGETRRITQLGLSILLATRCDLYAAGAYEQRLPLGGTGLAQLAIARCCRIAVRFADHVQ